MNMANCYIYSAEKDSEYVRHVKHVLKHFPKYSVSYSLGNVSNCPLEEILSIGTNQSSVFILSYKHIPQYTQIEGSFLWCGPRYRTTKFENKFIAIDVNLETEQICHLLRILIPPTYEKEIDLATPLIEIKNYKDCSNRKSTYLK